MRQLSVVLSILIALAVAALPASALGGGHFSATDSHQSTHSNSHAPTQEGGHAHAGFAVSKAASSAPAGVELGLRAIKLAANGFEGDQRASDSACCDLAACHGAAFIAAQYEMAIARHEARPSLPIEHQAVSSPSGRIERPPRAA